jgi:hypothetical protein
MADEKKGRSEEKTDAWGNKYIQHYDEHGDKAGWSREDAGVFGEKYVQHYDNDSKKTAWSEEKIRLLGDRYTQHHDNDPKNTGWSEERTAFLGGSYTQHHRQDSEKTGWSQAETGSFGGRYVQHYGSAPPYIRTEERQRKGHSTGGSGGRDGTAGTGGSTFTWIERVESFVLLTNGCGFLGFLVFGVGGCAVRVLSGDRSQSGPLKVLETAGVLGFLLGFITGAIIWFRDRE